MTLSNGSLFSNTFPRLQRFCHGSDENRGVAQIQENGEPNGKEKAPGSADYDPDFCRSVFLLYRERETEAIDDKAHDEKILQSESASGANRHAVVPASGFSVIV